MVGGLQSLRAQVPRAFSDKILRQTFRVTFFDRQIFPSSAGANDTRFIPQLGFGFEDSILPIQRELGGKLRRLARFERREEAHVQLGTVAKPFGLHGAGPDHCLVE